MQGRNGSNGDDGHSNHRLTETYLITDDVRALLVPWGRERGLIIPPPSYFRTLTSQLVDAAQDALGDRATVRVVEFDFLADRIASLVRRYASDVPLVSIERSLVGVAIPGQQCSVFDATRRVQYLGDSRWENLGVGPRPGCPSLEEQARKIARAVRGLGYQEFVLIDDGVYAGESLEALMEHLKHTGVRVRCMIVGIRNVKSRDQKLPTDVHEAIPRYEPGELYDWLCARDFLIGCPEGGRVVVHGGNGHALVPDGMEYGAPYLNGFGDFAIWATLPEHTAKAFTDRALELAQRLYAEIERLSGRPVCMRDIVRWPHYGDGPLRCDPEHEIVEVIGQLRSETRVHTPQLRDVATP